MGQYFQFVNIDKKETIKSWDYDNGMKEMEHSFVGNGYVEAVIKLLKNEWKGDRIIHLGDYANELADNEDFAPMLEELKKVFHLEGKIEDISFSDIWEKCKVVNPSISKSEMEHPTRYILVDDNKYIDRYNVKYGENNYIPKGYDKNKGISENIANIYRDEKTNERNFWLVKVDPFSLSLSLGEGGGGSYYFEDNPEKEDIHGCLIGHRFSATNDKNLIKNKEEIDLSEFGFYGTKDLFQVFSKEDVEKIFKQEKKFMTEKEISSFENFLNKQIEKDTKEIEEEEPEL